MLAAGQGTNWCHHFARAPAEAFTSSHWRAFADTLGIDLRSLPYSFLVLARPGLPPAAPRDPAAVTRLLGRARQHKGFAQVLGCDAEGVRELTLQKRDVPEVFKSLKDEAESPLLRLRVQGDRVRAAEWWPALP